MDEKTKLYVFTRTEVILIFILVILVAPTFFFIGLKMGMSYSYKEAGITEQHRLELDMLSKKEEALANASLPEDKKEMEPALDEDSMKMIKRKLEDMESLEKVHSKQGSDEDTSSLQQVEEKDIVKDPFLPNDEPSTSLSPRDELAGKYTIQLASYVKINDATAFAEGFKVRGYSPIISEVEVNAQRWYRVSLGSFDTISDAKEYIKKERELFQGSNYVISKFE